LGSAENRPSVFVTCGNGSDGFWGFGITGVGGDEIMYYNYWCIEKGYAAIPGPMMAAWNGPSRAKGWFKVMYLDAVLSMVVYTIVTAAFYLLGAAVLHDGGKRAGGLSYD
jgi:manganese transport protein